MDTKLKIAIIIIASYLTGCINLSYILAKLKGYDIRKHGSGNAGASNVILLMGRKAGLFVAIVDVLKAFVIVMVMTKLFPDIDYAGALSGTFVIIGHIFPFHMQFKGGKGFATLGGTVLALDARLFVVLLLISLFIAFVTNYICFVPMSMSVAAALIYGWKMSSYVCMIILLVAAVCINLRHIENIKRIRLGTEARFSTLWNRKAEADRFGVDMMLNGDEYDLYK